jgi:hypothetical protein
MHRVALASLLVAAGACHSSRGPEDYPKLAEGDGPEVAAKPIPAETMGARPPEPVGAGPVLFEPTGSACMPTGVYDVTFDLSDAKLTVAGQDEAFCRSMLEAVPQQALSQMKIAIEAGTLAIYWPGKAVALATSPCTFSIKSQPVFTTITFANGTGTGLGDYAVGSSNHPGEKCEAKGAKLLLVRASS